MISCVCNSHFCGFKVPLIFLGYTGVSKVNVGILCFLVNRMLQ